MANLDNDNGNLEYRVRELEDTLRRLRRRKSVRLALLISQPFGPVVRQINTLERRLVGHTRNIAVRIFGRERAKSIYGKFVQFSDLVKSSKKQISRDFATKLPSRSPSLHSRFDLKRSRDIALSAVQDRNQVTSEKMVSVIMPVRNRQNLVARAIESVLSQSHQNFELLVIDDGSDDKTAEIVGQMAKTDSRVRLIRTSHVGVSRARNLGLENAKGSYVAFLDSDNEWSTDFLKVMIFKSLQGYPFVYCAMQVDAENHRTSYRGMAFDEDELRRGNFIDLNCILLERSAFGELSFDPGLARYVDWDVVLLAAQHSRPEYIEYVGVRYTDNDGDRISNSVSPLFRRVIENRIREVERGLSYSDARKKVNIATIPLEFGIAISAPRSRKEVWGDYHYAVSLRHSLERHGMAAKIYFHNEKIDPRTDAVISLLGLTKPNVPKAAVSIAWVISHPQIFLEAHEDEFDHVFVASDSFALFLTEVMGWSNVDVLHQCSDPSYFYPPTTESQRGGVLFVGNSRQASRPLVEFSAAQVSDIEIYGEGWEQRIPDHVWKGTSLSYRDLPQKYRQASVVINDHWPSMRDFGIISNRVWDALATATPVLNDAHPAAERVFGPEVTSINPNEFAESGIMQVVECLEDVPEEVASWVMRENSFDTRAAAILRKVQTALTNDQLENATPNPSFSKQSPSIPRRDTLRVAVLPQYTKVGPSSSAFIRLLLPFTTDHNSRQLEFNILDEEACSQVDALREVDYLVVSRVAISDQTQAEKLLESLRLSDTRLVIDMDDALHLMTKEHDEFAIYEPRLKALNILLENANGIVASTNELAATLGVFNDDVTVIRNSLDPRLWRPYARYPSNTMGHGRTRLLYFGTSTHDGDFRLVENVLHELTKEGLVDVTLIGVTGRAIPWAEQLRVPNGRYPEFVRWLRLLQPEFDVGIAPLNSTLFNSYKSELKILEYRALGLPVIASDWGPYRRQIVGDTAARCASEEQWRDEIIKAVQDVTRSRHDASFDRITPFEYQEEEELLWRSIRQTSHSLSEYVSFLVDL